MPTEKRKTLAVAELVEDLAIYPRYSIDRGHVASLAAAIEAGAQLPPVVADDKSRRIVDGWHRCRAQVRVYGPEATIDAVLIAYPSEAAMRYDAVARNAWHGKRLGGIDAVRSVILLRNSGFDDSQIAAALQVPERKVEVLSVRVARAAGKAREGAIPGTRIIALKRSVAHLEGRSLTPSQVRVHALLPGTPFSMVAHQLTLAIREGMVDLGDERIVSSFTELHEALGGALAEAAAMREQEIVDAES